jgi:predicted acetyltransferase
MAILNASEAAIYGRFGYGISSWYHSVGVPTARATFRRPALDAPLALVPQDQARDLVSPMYDRWCATRPGALSRSRAWWDAVLGERQAWRGGGSVFVVVCDAEPGGFAIYTIDNTKPLGAWIVEVRELCAGDPIIEGRLWRYLLEIDLVGQVIVEARPTDDPLRWELADPRAYGVTALRDYLQVRLLDVPAALQARTYDRDATLTLAVHDPFRPATDGNYHLRVVDGVAAVDRGPLDPGGADLELDVADLGSLYLGGVAAHDLAVTGRLTERAAGAVNRAEQVFTSRPAPFCATRF